MIPPYIAEVVLYALNFAPKDWSSCAGQLLPINQTFTLFSVIQNTFGGNGKTSFALPDYRKLNPTGVQYCIAVTGVFPSSS